MRIASVIRTVGGCVLMLAVGRTAHAATPSELFQKVKAQYAAGAAGGL